MKKLVLILTVITVSFSSVAQESNEFKPNGSPHFKVFWNYHADLTKGATRKSAFELNRSYFGYNYNFSETISSKITFDVGNNDAGSDFTAFLKIAQLDWKVAPNVLISMGMIGNLQFDDQEDLWGYRYMFKSFQDEFKFGSSADLGVNAKFTLSEKLDANFLIFNGEGYTNLQDENGNQRFGSSLVYRPIEGLFTKIYVDAMPDDIEETMLNISLSAGYQLEKIRFGAEFNQLNNGERFDVAATGKDLDGLSFYSTYTFSPKFEVFGRFDQLSSNTLSGEATAWNESRDGNQIVAGFQYAPVKGIKFALNYQGFNFDQVGKETENFVFLNAEFKL